MHDDGNDGNDADGAGLAGGARGRARVRTWLLLVHLSLEFVRSAKVGQVTMMKTCVVVQARCTRHRSEC